MWSSMSQRTRLHAMASFKGSSRSRKTPTVRSRRSVEFGIFPNTEFSAADPSKVRRYSFPLPRDVLQDGPVKLTVHVVPLRGEGDGARIEVGGAEIK